MFCTGCYEKQLKIDRLQEENIRLKQKLRYEERKTKDGYFGNSTPSSKKPFKENGSNIPKKNGGAKKGHKGYGRKSTTENEADIIEHLNTDEKCPYCNEELEIKETIERTVIESVPVKAKKVLYKCQKKWCPRCRKTITKKPIVLPRSLYGNQLITQAAILHYGHGVPLGKVENILGNRVPSGSLHDIFHRLARLWQPVIPKLIQEYRNAPVKHADETGWRTDGNSGFAWIFCTQNLSIFQFADTRSRKIALAILGEKRLQGTLVVDRYQAYNKSPCKIQYCYAHLLRKVEDLGKEFIDNSEVQRFVSIFAPLLSKAMHLRSMKITNKTYYRHAKSLKRKILKVVDSPSNHAGIKEIQLIFKENKKRLYHWCANRQLPAENNRAERELRPTVIARKVSFGSQSENGAHTRSILMSILQTAQKRLKTQTLEEWFKESLDKIALDPHIDPYSLLPPPAT